MIHGRAQERKDAVELKKEWETALKLGFKNAFLEYPDDLELDFSYYGDILFDLEEAYRSGKDAKKYKLKSTEETEDDPIANLQEEILEELLSKIEPPEITKDVNELPEMIDKGLIKNRHYIGIAKALENIGWLGNWSLEKETSDVAAYLSVPHINQQIDSFVQSYLEPDTTVVIGHSLGSVVAFNALQKVDISINKIELFITLGSPLAVKPVIRQLNLPLKKPNCLAGEWINIYDKKDLVALHPLELPYFHIDHPITNISMDNESEERHDIKEYISDPLVASKIYQLCKNSNASK